jgi:hypothetical protein
VSSLNKQKNGLDLNDLNNDLNSDRALMDSSNCYKFICYVD